MRRIAIILALIQVVLASTALADPLADSDTMLQQSLALSREGKFETVEALVKDALALRKSALEPRDSRMGEGFSIAGKVYYNKGDYEAAERYFRDALTIIEGNEGPAALNTSLKMGDLAASLRQQRKYRAAEDIVLSSLALRRKLLPANDPIIGGNLENIGRTYLETGRYAAAARSFAEAHGIYAVNWGADDPDVKREHELVELAQRKRIAFRVVAGLLVLFPFLCAGLVVLAESPNVQSRPSYLKAVAIALRLLIWGFKILAILFGAITLMPTLMWILPSPLNADQIQPVASIVGAASGLIAIFALVKLLNFIGARIRSQSDAASIVT